MDSTAGQKTPLRPTGYAGQAEDRRDGKTTFRGERVDYSVATGEAVATGPSLITFDVNDRTEGAAGRPFDSAHGSPFDSAPLGYARDRQGRPFDSAPLGYARDRQNRPATVVITSQRQVKFTPASNTSVFEGNCKCTMTQAQGDATRQHFVLADKIEVDLAKKGNDDGSASSLNVRRFIATGGDVHLASTKRLDQRLLAGLELKCARMDYDTVDGNFFAEGPGLIKVDNSQTDEPQKGLSRFSLRRKCYAFLRQFDSLEYDSESNQLTADSKSGSLLVDYFPINETDSTSSPQGGREDKVAVTASHVDADILETSQGRMDLKGFTAKGAVTYQDRNTQVVGSEFVYDANSSVIDIRGDRYRPCYFNGVIIDAAKYDVKTGRWNTRIKGPGAIK
jgi:hypothetical protein